MKKFAFLVLVVLSAFKINAQDGFNLYALGNKEMNEGNYRKAEEYYLAAYAKEPQNWNILTQLGYCYHRQLKFRAADSVLNIACSQDSTTSKPFWYKGMNHVKLKQDSMVVVCYKKFLDIEKKHNGNLTLGYKNVGWAYERLIKSEGLYSWQIDDMIYHFEQLERIDPMMPDIPNIQNFIEIVKVKRPANQTGKWKLTL